MKEVIKEDWVIFVRKKFDTGTIDFWTGDSAHNPNEAKMKNFNLNSMATWLRINNGQWINTSGQYKSNLKAVIMAANPKLNLFDILETFRKW